MSGNNKYIRLKNIYVTMTEKMGSDEEKSDFAFLAFFVLYYINKALCENLMAISKVLFEIWPFYISAY
jgi:hypothetical protein